MIIENGVERTRITVHKEFIVGKAVCVCVRLFAKPDTKKHIMAICVLHIWIGAIYVKGKARANLYESTRTKISYKRVDWLESFRQWSVARFGPRLLTIFFTSYPFV